MEKKKDNILEQAKVIMTIGTYAKFLKDSYDSFISVGFTEPQAFKMILELIKKPVEKRKD